MPYWNLRTAVTIGAKLFWLPVCMLVASGAVGFVARPPGDVVAVLARWDGFRIATSERRPQPAPWVPTLAGGLALYAFTWLRPVRSRPKLAYLSFAALAVLIEGGEPWRRWQRNRQLLAVAPVAWTPPPHPFFQRGVSFIRDGFNAYMPEPTARSLDQFQAAGIDAVAVVPYGWHQQGTTRIDLGREAGDAVLYQSLIHLAHGRGIRVMLKPQLWVRPGGYPGSIRVTDAAARREWFASYEQFILHWAGVAATAQADVFVVGTELEHLTADTEAWRRIVQSIRQVYKGPLTYAANQGADFERLQWWDALDYIGLNEYYPLNDSLDFTPILNRITAVYERFKKPVILTEVGFASVATAHRAPWDEPRLPVNLAHQQRCYEALFQAFWHQPWFYGMYWWKIGADGRGGPQDASLTPWRKPAMQTLARYYRNPRPPHKPSRHVDTGHTGAPPSAQTVPPQQTH